jgi:hypothetical protein
MVVKDNRQKMYRRMPVGHLPFGSYFMISGLRGTVEVYTLIDTTPGVSLAVDYKNGEEVAFDPNIKVEHLFHVN